MSTLIKGTGTPARIFYEGEGDTYKPVRGSRCEYEIKVQDPAVRDFLINMFGSADDMYRIRVYKNNELYWIGAVVHDFYFEQFNKLPFNAKVVAEDGLGRLQNIPFVGDDNAPLTGYASMIDIILICLNKLNLELPLITADAIRATIMDDTDPLDQGLIDMSVFVDRDGNPLSCYDVLEQILKKKGITIRQSFIDASGEIDYALDEFAWRLFGHANLELEMYEYLPEYYPVRRSDADGDHIAVKGHENNFAYLANFGAYIYDLLLDANDEYEIEADIKIDDSHRFGIMLSFTVQSPPGSYSSGIWFGLSRVTRSGYGFETPINTFYPDIRIGGTNGVSLVGGYPLGFFDSTKEYHTAELIDEKITIVGGVRKSGDDLLFYVEIQHPDRTLKQAALVPPGWLGEIYVGSQGFVYRSVGFKWIRCYRYLIRDKDFQFVLPETINDPTNPEIADGDIVLKQSSSHTDTMTFPPNMQVNDLILFIVIRNDVTQLRIGYDDSVLKYARINISVDSTRPIVGIFYRIADGTEPETVTFTSTGTSSVFASIRLSNINLADIFGESSSVTTDTTDTHTVPSLTSKGKSILLSVLGLRNVSSGTVVFPADMDVLISQFYSNARKMYVAQKEIESGATGDKVWSWDTAVHSNNIMFNIQSNLIPARVFAPELFGCVALFEARRVDMPENNTLVFNLNDYSGLNNNAVHDPAVSGINMPEGTFWYRIKDGVPTLSMDGNVSGSMVPKITHTTDFEFGNVFTLVLIGSVDSGTSPNAFYSTIHDNNIAHNNAMRMLSGTLSNRMTRGFVLARRSTYVSSIDVDLQDGDKFILIYRRNGEGDNHSWRYNRLTVTQNSPATYTGIDPTLNIEDTTTQKLLGNSYGAGTSSPLDGDIRLFSLYNRVLTDSECEELESYASEYYGITLES
jgi:hypothetical protein